MCTDKAENSTELTEVVSTFYKKKYFEKNIQNESNFSKLFFLDLQDPDDVINVHINAMKIVYRDFNVFEKFNTDKYLGSFGLVVRPEYRGRGIGIKLMAAR